MSASITTAAPLWMMALLLLCAQRPAMGLTQRIEAAAQEHRP
jgi:hypothetical protein